MGLANPFFIIKLKNVMNTNPGRFGGGALGLSLGVINKVRKSSFVSLKIINKWENGYF